MTERRAGRGSDNISGSTPLMTSSEYDVSNVPTLHELATNNTSATSGSFKSLTFDPKAFIQFVEDENLTEAEATLLLRAIWDIVVAFVDLGFGLNPVQQALVERFKKGEETLPRSRGDGVSSKDQFSKSAKQNVDQRQSAAPRRRRIHE